MKSKISQAAKKSVSLLLAILMMFSMLTVAMTVTVNAATYDTMYLCGKINGENKWDSTDYGMTLQDGIWSITLDLKNGDEIKVRPTTSNWNVEYGKADNDTSNYSITEDANYTVSIPDGAANKTGITVVKNVVSDKYTVTVGSTTGGAVELVSTSPAAANTEFEFKVKANDGYQIGTVTLSDGTTLTTGSVDSNGYTHYTFTMPSANVTINATFTSTETPSKNFYFFYWNSRENVKNDMGYKNGSYYIYTNNTLLSNSRQFKIADVTSLDGNDNADHAVNYNSPVLDASPNAGVSISNLGGTYCDLQLSGTGTEYVITYTPDYAQAENGLKGTVKVWSVAEFEAQGDTPTACITIKPTSLTNMGVSEVAPITATHSATCAGALTWIVSEGTDVISIIADSKEPYTYKVTALKPGTAKVKITCDVTGESVECPVEVKRLPFAETGRIYAYAGKTLPTDTTLVSDAWIAAETNNKLSIYGDGSNEAATGAVKNYPTLGSASETDLCIYLPSSAATDKVTLYNASEGDLVVGDKTITKGNYGEVSYTDGTSQNITLNGASKTLTIYRSNATGALYLNNSGSYAGNENGVPNMITQLYSGKDTGELGKNTGNYGAYTDKNGNVKFAGVSKVKGRGNSTWKYTDKKSFNVTFTDAFKAFGFDQGGKKYSLLANFKDPSLSRNKILYQLGKDVFGVNYVPKTATVDLYMNGLYMGSYLMTQKIELGSKEVVDDVDGATLFEELYTDPANQTADIQNKGFSFLMELDSNAGDGSSTTDPDYYTTAGDGQKLTIKEPEYGFPGEKGYNESVDNAIKAFVKSKYNQLKDALNNTSITYEALNAIVDVDSLTRYFLLNEFAKNYDIGVSSTYFVYKCELDAEGNVTGGKFYASPVWDMDVTASNCEKENNNYSSYEGDWSNNNNNDWNVIMKAAFGNPVIQNAADAIWTPAFYTTLTNSIKTLATNAKNDLDGSYENNFRKWTYPYDFNGQGDNVQPHTSLEGGLATFNVSNAEYTKTLDYTDNTYDKYSLDGGQIDFLEDWLLSRAAWMTKKYNDTITSTTQDFYIERYYDANGGDNGSSHYVKMDYNEANGTYSSEVNFAENKWVSGGNTVYRFGIVTESGAGRDEVAKSVTAYKGETAITNYVTISDTTDNLTGVSLSEYKDVDLTFADASADLTYIVTYKPGTGNVLDGTITITKKSTSTTSDPKVSITGSTLTEIKVGAKVNITATVTPVMINGVAQAGDYTVTLLRNGSAYESITVTFSDLTLSVDTSQTVTFTDVPLETERDVFTATVSATIDGQSYSASAQTPVKYINEGARDQKIYFDPSGKVSASDDWKSLITSDAVVTMTVGGKDFPMYIDSEEKYALEKGVFRTEVDAATLALMQKPETQITFKLGERTATINGASTVKDGSIYTHTDESQPGKNAWSDYNVAPVEEYPFDAATYEEFVTALNANQTQRILYFDNSVSGWHNVYFYSWNDAGGVTDDTLQMKKIPNTDVWYYDFGTAPTADFLFKDRSGNAFGTDYQQTVDLVGSLQEDGKSDNFVRNGVGDGEEVYIYFTSSYQNNKNPIFITSTFYNCTPKNAEDNKGSTAETMLKYRAFNTEWKNYAAVLASAVKTKAVDIYFDLHDKATVDSITIYHKSIEPTNWDFPAAFTRLNRIGTSTIYRGTVDLPYYTDNNELKRHFNFTKFVIGSDEYAIAENGAGQPTAEFINTGKIWFEINKNVNVSTCNIISYNTASANFSATNGGTVSDIKAVISNGYYDTNGIDTGYTEVQSDGSVTVYYALVNGTTGPVVKFTAKTAHVNEGTGNGEYSFDGWEKDGTLIADAGIVTDKTVTDSIKTVNTVNYVANWSQEQYVKFTFTYIYFDHDTHNSTQMEFNNTATAEHTYEVTVMVSQDDAADENKVKELYLNYQPKISSDYYTYAFDQTVTVDTSARTATSEASKTAKVYKLSVKDSEGLLVKNETYFYQNLVQLTAIPATGKTIEWRNNGLVIGYGNNIAFRITDTNTVITYSQVDAAVVSDRTVLHKPTYEFFTENNVEKVRFNFLVENKVQDLSNVELGVLYFFTDKDGANSTVYPGGANIPENVLKAAATSGATGINKKVITYANFKGEYIFNAKISNTEANKQKYLRVYSYIKDKTTGEVILSDTTTPVIASISYATAT